jgi:dolichol kinase
MCFANCQLGGIDFAFPDICLTPPLPIPVAYPNFGFGFMAIPNVLHILFAALPAHNMGTIIPITFGDEAGSFGGVCSGTVMGPSRHITGVLTFFIAGFPATRVSSLTQQNLTNAIGMRILCSQPKIILMCP